MNKPFGEIIESSLTHWKVQCWQWDVMPAFGSLVVITQGSSTIYGIVTHIQTGSNDPGRVPFAYQKTEEELHREQPQIFALLQTTVTCMIVGYEDEHTLLYQLPPYPTKIHAFVQQATPDQLRAFYARPTFLPMLANQSSLFVSIEDVLLTIIKQLHELNMLERGYLDECIRMFSTIIGNDYRRLKMFTHRLEHLLQSQAR